ncbi:UNVERIFIED_CONTAM: hypothetical protein GTU68_043653 [Idotea baltica]|nr:hypothetical protein [Idotea baltica]
MAFSKGFSLFVFCVAGCFSSSALGADFDESLVIERARELAEKPYVVPPELPKPLRDLNYDQYRAIQPSEKGTIWKAAGLPFRLEFFHPGYLFQKPVKMNFVDSYTNEITRFPFDSELFDYSKLVLDENFDPGKIAGYAGFRIQFPIHENPKNFDEIGSFLGASYFRLLGFEQRYGISARGLALNVTNHEAEEEFPDFVEYWFVNPEEKSRVLEFYALLDSPSVTGAYHFKIKPGASTEADVEATLFFRKSAVENIKSVGLAPLTSMFWYGENSSERNFQDWRPEVHDSDGLLFKTWNNETVWRPLFNAKSIRFTHFNAPDVQGFGLLQRDRDFHHYEDLSNPYHRTPTAWITPKKKWGEGAVRLIELPTENEAIDNIVSFFEPQKIPLYGEKPLTYGYTLSMKMLDEEVLSPNRVASTRVGMDVGFPDTRRFVIDFEGEELEALAADSEILAEITSSENGFVDENQCFKNVVTEGWRVEFKLDTKDENTTPVELRCVLKNPKTGKILSETWSYQWTP